MLRRTPSQSHTSRTAGRKPLTAMLSSALALPLAVAGLAAAVGSAPSASAASSYNLANPSFTTNTSGWYSSTQRGVLNSTPGRTGNAARLTHTATSSYGVILNDAKNTVSSTEVGSSYTATAWVRASVPTTVSIRMQEWRDGVKRGEIVSSATVGTTWTMIGASYVAKVSGAQIDLNVLSTALKAGASMDVDDVTFRVRTPTWRDDFNGTSLNTANWSAMNNSTFGDGNGELACLMNRPANLGVANGMLSLRAQRETTPLKCGSNDTRFPNGRDYSSAFVQSLNKQAFTYGRFEVRAKLPTAQGVSKGLWPAFWMRPTSGGTGELDILEALGSSSTGTEYNRSHQTIHYDYVRTYAPQSNTAVMAGTALPSSGFHTYTAEWDADRILWFVDGQMVYFRDTTTTSWLASTFNKPMYLRLNLSVGGSWPGTPDAATAFPSSYDIDYVSVHSPAA